MDQLLEILVPEIPTADDASTPGMQPPETVNPDAGEVGISSEAMELGSDEAEDENCDWFGNKVKIMVLKRYMNESRLC